MFSVLRRAGLAGVEIMASSRCVVGSSANCTTGVIPAGRFVDHLVDHRLRPPACTFQLREVGSGALVGRGVLARGRATGLSGSYQLELRRCSSGAVGVIDNE